jgi:hypothetical protein
MGSTCSIESEAPTAVQYIGITCSIEKGKDEAPIL